MLEQGQALNSPIHCVESPVQQSQHRRSASSSPKQSPLQSEPPSFGLADPDQAEQGSFAALIEEAANATHQVHLLLLLFFFFLFFLFLQGLPVALRSLYECWTHSLSLILHNCIGPTWKLMADCSGLICLADTQLAKAGDSPKSCQCCTSQSPGKQCKTC